MSEPADLELIVAAARAAGAAALGRQGELGALEIGHKADATPVTSADLEANAILKEALLGARPDYGWLSEESWDDRARLRRDRVFVVDPIDGTRAFIRGRPDYVVSVAVVEDGRPVAAALCQPAVGALYAASAGGGATLNGAPIRVADTGAVEGARLVCPPRDLSPKLWRTPWPDSLTVGYGNSMAYRIAIVASGEWNGALALSGKSDWDLAAADLIVTEAGGVITGLDGAMLRYNQDGTRKAGVVCGAPRFHAALMRRLEEWRNYRSHGDE